MRLGTGYKDAKVPQTPLDGPVQVIIESASWTNNPGEIMLEWRFANGARGGKHWFDLPSYTDENGNEITAKDRNGDPISAASMQSRQASIGNLIRQIKGVSDQQLADLLEEADTRDTVLALFEGKHPVYAMKTSRAGGNGYVNQRLGSFITPEDYKLELVRQKQSLGAPPQQESTRADTPPAGGQGFSRYSSQDTGSGGGGNGADDDIPF